MSLLQVHNQIVSQLQLQIEGKKQILGILTYYVITSIANFN
jgi:hypothetical protein